MSNNFLKFPLALLRQANTPVDFFEKAAAFAVVNAGIGFTHKHGKEAFLLRVDELRKKIGLMSKRICGEALVGADLCGVKLGDHSGLKEVEPYNVVSDRRGDSPVVSVASDIFWAACSQARRDAGIDTPVRSRTIQWREWRIFVALASLPHNRYGFSIAGWESVRCRACGFHRKEDFQTFQEAVEPWPDHCLPLTRWVVDSTLKRLESLNFFIRHRIGKGGRGGLTAYSFRHSDGTPEENRESLARDCEEWQGCNQGQTVRENRAHDLKFHLALVAERKAKIKEIAGETGSLQQTSKSAASRQ